MRENPHESVRLSGAFGVLNVKAFYIQGIFMPGTWDTSKYRERAKKWREAAEALPPGKERDACMVLAKGYANLAALIEKEDIGCIGRPPGGD